MDDEEFAEVSVNPAFKALAIAHFEDVVEAVEKVMPDWVGLVAIRAALDAAGAERDG